MVVSYINLIAGRVVVMANTDLLAAILLTTLLLTLLIYPVKNFCSFIFNLSLAQTGVNGESFLIAFATIFTIILFANFAGIVPGNFCLTSQLFVTLTLSSFVFWGVVLYYLITNGLLAFLKQFIPSNAPLFLIPFLVVVESLSYFSRVISLAVRLFANMVAGHSLLHILLSFLIQLGLLLSWQDVAWVALLSVPFLLIGAIYMLEFGIAFLQSYVFLVLFCIYLRDVFESSH